MLLFFRFYFLVVVWRVRSTETLRGWREKNLFELKTETQEEAARHETNVHGPHGVSAMEERKRTC